MRDALNGRARGEFRFKTWRPSRAPDTLRIDEAIDRIGNAILPQTWGLQAHFNELPLFWQQSLYV